MRINAFGERYCQTFAELRATIDEVAEDADALHAVVTAAGEGAGFTAEVLDNVSGEIVCYAEAATVADIVAMLGEAEVEIVE